MYDMRAKVCRASAPLAIVAAAVPGGRISVRSAAGDGASYNPWQPERLPYSWQDGWNCRSTARPNPAWPRLGFLERGLKGFWRPGRWRRHFDQGRTRQIAGKRDLE